MSKRRYRSLIPKLPVLVLIIAVFTCLAVAGYRSPLDSERARAAKSENTGKLRIIAFGAHPDDCEIKAGGVAAMWAAQGHHVKFVSTTNGDIGHFKMAGGPLAQRRTEEVERAAKILGISRNSAYQACHSGELPMIRIGKRILVAKMAIEKLLRGDSNLAED